ncbi:MAG: SIMPL domain-containing protein [Humibacillus sp.]|nr:SIMPL domain-containing protein [Humibacillus sp.]MDN5779925.1 SIMPL domain-containing protein [Humibacillus sp.]
MGKRTVTVIGSGSVQVSPDVVRLYLRVGHDAPDVAAALSGATQGITSVIEAVRAAEVADSDIRTLDASVNQRWDNTGNPVGFTAQQQLSVVVRRLDATGEILEAGAAAVGNALLVDQVRLDVYARDDAERQARDAAFANAQSKAEQYAALAGCRLGVALGVAELGATPVGAQRQKGFAASMSMAASGMPVEGGDLDVSTSITVTWELRTAK